MYPLNELKVIYGITSQCRRELHRKIFESLQLLSQIERLYVIDDI